MIGLDTTAIIDIFKGEEKIKKFLESNKEPLAATMMSYLELFFGLDLSNSKHAEEAMFYEEFFNIVHNFGLTHSACEQASRIFWHLRKEGKTIEQFDCTIAAIMIESGITRILTRNLKHFENIKDLKVITY